MARTLPEARRVELIQLIQVAHGDPQQYINALQAPAFEPQEAWTQLALAMGDTQAAEKIQQRKQVEKLLRLSRG